MKPSLLIMAAGMGSRYGGLKQIDPVGPGGEILLDYAVYDALEVGFGRVVLIIRRSFEDEIRALVSERFGRRAPVEFVCQELDAAVEGYSAPPDRTKPWGTAHAVLTARDAIHEPFAVANADDFYGRESMRMLREHLDSGTEFGLIGFRLDATLSERGTVSRGVCECDESMRLRRIVEHEKIARRDGAFVSLGKDGSLEILPDDAYVSMNLWGFQPGVFGSLAGLMQEFLDARGEEPKAEFYLPTAVDTMIRRNEESVLVLPTPERWFGMTYQEDKAEAIANIRALIAEGRYPETLWT